MPSGMRALLSAALILIPTQTFVHSLERFGGIGGPWPAPAAREDDAGDILSTLLRQQQHLQPQQQHERGLRLQRQRAHDGRFLSPVVRDGVPEGVKCHVTERCDSRNVCARVCDRGSVAIDPWLRFAVDYQWRLSRRQPLCFAQLLGTHNSAISLADGYGMHDDIYTEYLQYLGLASPSQRLVTNNQALSLTDQLNLGVRFLELDVHWIQSGLHIAHCGGFHSPPLNQLVALLSDLARLFGHPPVEWDAETVGCDPSLSSLPAGDQRSFADALSEVAAWLTAPANAREFLVLYLDNQLDLQSWGKVGELLGQVVAAIPASLIISPPELRNITAHQGSWPSMDELAHVYGKRLLLMSGSDYGPEMSWLAFSHHSLCGLDEPLFRGFSGPPNCSFHNWRYDMDTPVMTGRMFRTPTCHLTYGPYNCSIQRGENTPQLDAQLLPPATSCGINVPAPDLLTPELVQSYIWSWAPGHAPPPLEGPPPAAVAATAAPNVVAGPRLGDAVGAGREEAEADAVPAVAAAPAVCVVMRSGNGRWVVQPECRGATHAACRRNAGPQHLSGAAAWLLVPTEPGLEAAAATSQAAGPGGVSCPRGYVRSAPHTARENWELWQMVTQLQREQRQQQQQRQEEREREQWNWHWPWRRWWSGRDETAGGGDEPAADVLVVLALDPFSWLPADLTRGVQGPLAT